VEETLRWLCGLLPIKVYISYAPTCIFEFSLRTGSFNFDVGNMRQLKGKTKETAREKRQRKQEFRTNKDKLLSVALPAFAGFWLFVIVFIYFSVQPKTVSSN
jgi:hypothetical protein